MKLYLASDLHLDISGLLPDENIPYMGGTLLLAGDTCEVAAITAGYKLVRQNLAQICNAFDQVFMIPGNHEYYDGHIAYAEDILRLELPSIADNITLLQKDIVELEPGLSLIAATLWTDMNKEDPMDMLRMPRFMSDYNYIKNTSDVGLLCELSVHDVVDIHKDHLKFLSNALKTTENRCVVMTHHAPLKELFNEERARRHYFMNVPGYVSDLQYLIEEHTDKLPLWVYGHTHENRETVIGNTRIVTNARGYYNYGKTRFMELHV